MSALHYLLVIGWLAILMIVHEGGHHLVARAFKMRVLRFSIGFGPPLWRYQPKGSDTVYQVALIPFLAYVQIDGMNPFEEIDPNDEASYANASLTARLLTVFAGPLANYLFASVLFFAALMIGGRPLPPSTTVNVIEGKAAAAANMQSGDKIVAIDGKEIERFTELQKAIQKSEGQPIAMEVERKGRRVQLTVTPIEDPESKRHLIGVEAVEKWVPVTMGEAAKRSMVFPAIVVRDLVVGLANIASLKMKDLSGPIGIVKIGAKRSDRGFHQLLEFMGILSAYLGGFNLLPIPALDGGRLIFLGYEAVARRKPNAKMEAHIHAVGLLMFLALMVVVSIFDIRN